MLNMYKSKQSESPLWKRWERLSLELNALVPAVEQCLPDEYWTTGRVERCPFQYDRALLSEFMQKDPRSNNLVAKARGMIWNNIFACWNLWNLILRKNHRQLFTSGIKVLVKVTVQFHELYGYSLTVLDIDPAIHWRYGSSPSGKKYYCSWKRRECWRWTKSLRYRFFPSVLLSFLRYCGRIWRFHHQLPSAQFGRVLFYTELFPALMQEIGGGIRVGCFDRIFGSHQWMPINEFTIRRWSLPICPAYLLAAACAQFHYLLSVLGMNDDTVLIPWSYRVKTPTVAAELPIHQRKPSRASDGNYPWRILISIVLPVLGMVMISAWFRGSAGWIITRLLPNSWSLLGSHGACIWKIICMEFRDLYDLEREGWKLSNHLPILVSNLELHFFAQQKEFI